ncbi:hypothetical protein [Vibrio sp. YIC-376]|uniref:hypothetical protein n=1 Tax=Vibrio sp. YIC-376 TaxID=3136162 RepID=UPI00402A72DF
MSFTTLPDITTSKLSFQEAQSATGSPDLSQTTLGGGFTVSQSLPVYLEGTLGYARYDPKYVFTDGEERRLIPTKWNSISVTGGIGYEFPLTSDNELKLRPIFNFSYGRVTTDAKLTQALLNFQFPDLDLDVIDGGTMNAYGLGGSIMLDWERYRDEYEIDLEVRYSNIQLRTFGSTSDGLHGESEANTAGVWARYRAPIGYNLLERPVRYVLETSFTSYFGEQRGALGFNNLMSVGAGLELDTSGKIQLVSRVRLVVRYIFGENVTGTSVGLAVSF